jgi:multicomponent Na+:H+ antiporter subunit G
MTMLATLTTPVRGIALATEGAGNVALAASGGGGLTSPLQAALVVALVAVGTFFLVVGVVGLVRLPTIYNRMHATSKATTLGASSMLLAGVLYFGGDGEGLAALVAIVFLFLTAPTGAHMISRAAQKMGVPFEDGVTWPGED